VSTADPWPEIRLCIDGNLRPASDGGTYDNVNPATASVAGVAADATTADLDDAVAAARRAFDESGWSEDAALRVRCLRQLDEALAAHADDLTTITVTEVGAPLGACAAVQVGEPLKLPAYYADLLEGYEPSRSLGVADTLGGPAERWVERVPAGVVGAITPWNVPTQINLAKVAPALAAGCTVVLKPAPETPWSALALGRLVHECTDVPPGVFNVVTGADPALGARLVADPRVDLVSFTGSTATGRKVMASAATNLTRVFLELGGKSAHVVLDDVDDIGVASLGAVFGMAMVAGQGCALTTRILLPRARYAEGCEALVSLMSALRVGMPDAPGTTMGPLISARQLERVEGYVDAGRAAGARVVCGGRRVDGLDGYFFEPTLLADVTNDMTVAREEIFGPVLVAIAHDGDDDAVAIANDSPYGLSGSVVSGDEARALAVARRIRTGTMSVNGGVWFGCDVPFGGFGASGMGREMGVAGLEEYLEVRAYARPAPTGPDPEGPHPEGLAPGDSLGSPGDPAGGPS
jgi:aldehyde dehydrogenase (NAD+)